MCRNDAAIARGEQRAFEQHRANAVALPRLLDREGGFGLAGQGRADRSQLRGTAQRGVDEKAVNERVDAE
jgi:hypothetical protein